MTIEIREADLGNAEDASSVLELVDDYARGPGGQNAPLSDIARANLAKGLAEHPMARVLLAIVDDEAIGVAVCVRSFSTFAGKPTVNIHDLAVRPEHQGRGVGRALIDRVEADARASGCCKVTLEVHDTNSKAKGLYRKAGFGPWEPATLFVSRYL